MLSDTLRDREIEKSGVRVIIFCLKSISRNYSLFLKETI